MLKKNFHPHTQQFVHFPPIGLQLTIIFITNKSSNFFSILGFKMIKIYNVHHNLQCDIFK